VLRKASPTPQLALEPPSQQCSILLLCLIGGLHGLTACRAEMGNQEAATGAVVSSHLVGEASLISRGSTRGIGRADIIGQQHSVQRQRNAANEMETSEWESKVGQ
jgi:hypothetical protein